MQGQGLKLETEVLSYNAEVRPPSDIRKRLQLPRNTLTGVLTLKRVVQPRTICFEKRFFPPDLASRFDPGLTSEKPVTDILQEMAGMPIIENTWQMQIIPAGAEVAKALGIIPGVLTLVNDSTMFFENGSPALVAMVFYPVDRVNFEFSAAQGRPSLLLGKTWRKK